MHRTPPPEMERDVDREDSDIGANVEEYVTCEGRSKTRTLAARKVEHPRQMLAESTTPFPCGFGG